MNLMDKVLMTELEKYNEFGSKLQRRFTTSSSALPAAANSSSMLEEHYSSVHSHLLDVNGKIEDGSVEIVMVPHRTSEDGVSTRAASGLF